MAALSWIPAHSPSATLRLNYTSQEPSKCNCMVLLLQQPSSQLEGSSQCFALISTEDPTCMKYNVIYDGTVLSGYTSLGAQEPSVKLSDPFFGLRT